MTGNNQISPVQPISYASKNDLPKQAKITKASQSFRYSLCSLCILCVLLLISSPAPANAQQVSVNGSHQNNGNGWGKGGKKHQPGADGETDWNNTGSDFNTAANWTGVTGATPPGVGDVAWFKPALINKTVDLSASVTLSGLYFNGTTSNGYSLTNSNAAAFTLTATGTTIGTEVSDSTAVAIGAENTSGTNTISAPIVFAPTSGGISTIYQAAGGTLELSGALSGSAGVTIAGPGIVIFSGTSANSYSGTTTIKAGQLELNKSAGTNAIAGNIMIGDGTGTDTLQLLASDQIANTSDVTLNSSGTPIFSLNSFNETIDALNSTNGSAVVSLGSGTLTVGANNEVAANFAGQILGTGNFVKIGSGTQILSGTNIFSGFLDILNGDLRFDSNGTANNATIRLGDTSGSNVAVLSLGSTSGNDIASALTVQSGSTGTKLLRSIATSGTNTFSGAITLNDNLTIESASNSNISAGTFLFQNGSIDMTNKTLTIDTQIYNSPSLNGSNGVNGQGSVVINEALTSSLAAGGALVKDGSNTLILQGTSNSYTGTNAATLNAAGTTIKDGVLGIYGDQSLGLAPGSAQDNIFFASSSLSSATNTPTLQDTANDITLAATRDINVANGVTARFDSNGHTFTINGSIDGSGNLKKIGSGSLVLNGANTFSGSTEVSAGSLNAAVTDALKNTSAVTVDNGATLILSGTGTLNRINDSAPITLGSTTGSGTATFLRSGSGIVSEGVGASRNGATVTGTSSIGLGALSLQSNATFDFGTLGVGTFVFNGFNSNLNTLNVLNWTSSASGLVSGVDGIDDRLIIASTAPVDTAHITFDGAASTAVLLDTQGLTSFYEIEPLSVIPEPSTWLAAGLALAALVYFQRRRFARFLNASALAAK